MIKKFLDKIEHDFGPAFTAYLVTSFSFCVFLWFIILLLIVFDWIKA